MTTTTPDDPAVDPTTARAVAAVGAIARLSRDWALAVYRRDGTYSAA